MTLNQIKALVRNQLRISDAQLMDGEVDLFLLTINLVKNEAESLVDFTANEDEATLPFSTHGGGSFDEIDHPDGKKLKTLLNILDENGVPVSWMTKDNYHRLQAKFRDEQEYNESRLSSVENYVFPSPKVIVYNQRLAPANPTTLEADTTLTYRIHGHYLTPDWINYTDTATREFWTTLGATYLMWQTINYLNYKFETFVPRQEGVLSAPEQKAQVAFEALKLQSSYQFNRGE